MKILLTIVFNLFVFALYGQWSTGNPVYFNNGNVGIGTPTPGVWFGTKTFEMSDVRPVFKLTSTSPTGLSTIVFTNASVNGTSHTGEFHLNYEFNSANNDYSLLRLGSYPAGNILSLIANGNVGIGTASPIARLEVAGGDLAIHDNQMFNLRAGISGQTGIRFNQPSEEVRISHTRDNYDRFIALGSYDVSNSWLAQFSLNTRTGNVGIGTTDPGSFKLAVNGKIWSQEVNVAMTNPGPDYVFEKDYNLLPLSELENYVTQNKHLPEVPSAKEMEKDGLNLKEMNLILLKKVEELTLHLIELKKENEKQETMIKKILNEK